MAALRELDVGPAVVRWQRKASPRPFDETIEVSRRRLCLPAERAGEVAELLSWLPVLQG